MNEKLNVISEEPPSKPTVVEEIKPSNNEQPQTVQEQKTTEPDIVSKIKPA